MNIFYIARQLIKKVKKRSIRANYEYLISYITDFFYDYRYGIQTSGIVHLSGLDIQSQYKDKGHDYDPTKVRHFHQIMKHFPFIKNNVFVDIGCGMGRVLLLASHYPFKRIVGIDFSPELCQIARKNWKIYKSKIRTYLEVEVYNTDILKYAFKGDENVFFLFNPFKEQLIIQFMRKLQISIRKNPRKAWLIYYHPVFENILKEYDFITKISEYEYAGRKYIFYSITS